MMPRASELVTTLHETGLIPVFSHLEVDLLVKVVDIAYRAGVKVFEFTHLRDNRGLRLFQYLKDQMAPHQDLILGVGTVLDVTMTERYLNAGAQFIASPFMRVDMAGKCIERNIPWMPGCSTLPEILEAKKLGADIISVLPGNVLGPEFVAPITKEYKDIFLVPSGGIDTTRAGLTKWFEANALCVKLGTALFPRETINLRDLQRVESNISNALKTIRQIKITINSLKPDQLA
jgi:2-dehydro-3-deoxyphosphogluconate aldolase/(4S)-4-hydroxy-2-oxoglutarate aldolase